MPPWLQTFLPLLRCPQTGQTLRAATAAEISRAGLPTELSALATGSGSHVYPIIDAMPHLLPGSAVALAAAD